MRGRLTLSSGPSVEVLTTSDVLTKMHVRVDTTDDDDYLDHLIVAAREAVDGRDGWLGRCLITQTWEWRLDADEMPTGLELLVPLPPLQSVSSITYLDTAGASQTWASSNYTVDTNDGGGFGRILLPYSGDWPTVRDIENAMTVTFVAGYGDAASDVPDRIKHGMLVMIADWYANRESVVIGQTVAELPTAAMRTLRPLKLRMP